jgi:hypothetical protein
LSDNSSFVTTSIANFLGHFYLLLRVDERVTGLKDQPLTHRLFY